jgi:hypothetical protein
MTSRTINVELVKASAEMAIPTLEWVVLPDGRAYGDSDMGGIFFDPLTSSDDFKALLLALMAQGWVFGKHYVRRDSRYFAINSGLGMKVFDESESLLLYACVSAMKNIPLYKDGDHV